MQQQNNFNASSLNKQKVPSNLLKGVPNKRTITSLLKEKKAKYVCNLATD
jgi:hypothetical protein